MATPISPKRSLPAEFDSDSEWEYEYSTTETETHYLTLDLTSLTTIPTPTVSHKKKRRDPFHPTIPTPSTTPAPTSNTRRRARATRITKAARLRQIDNPPHTEAETEAGDENGLGTEAETAAQPRGPGQGGEGEGEAEAQLQILDLETTNPLISYRGTIYSCEWTQPLGTDVLLVPPAEDGEGGREGEGETQEERDGGSRVINGRAGDEGPAVVFSEYRLMARPVRALPIGRQPGMKKRAQEKGGEIGAGDGKLNSDRNGNERRVRFAEPMQETASVPVDTGEGDIIPAITAPTPEQLPPQPSADTPASQQPSSTPLPAPSYQSPYPSQPIVTSPAASPPQTSQPTSSSLRPESSEPPAPSQRPQTSSLISTLTPNATPIRTAQASFLEKLISAKKSHGETDAVTVYATKPPTGTGWGMQAKARARLVATVPESRKKKGRDQEAILIEDKESDEEGDEAGDERDAAEGEKGDVEGNESRAAFEKDVDTVMRDAGDDRAGEEDDSGPGEGNQRR